MGVAEEGEDGARSAGDSREAPPEEALRAALVITRFVQRCQTPPKPCSEEAHAVDRQQFSSAASSPTSLPSSPGSSLMGSKSQDSAGGEETVSEGDGSEGEIGPLQDYDTGPADESPCDYLNGACGGPPGGQGGEIYPGRDLDGDNDTQHKSAGTHPQPSCGDELPPPAACSAASPAAMTRAVLPVGGAPSFGQLDLFQRPSNLVGGVAVDARRAGGSSAGLVAEVGELHVLLVFCNPRHTSHLRLQGEERAIRKAIAGGKFREQVRLTVLPAATIDDLSKAMLEDPPHVIHFSGHSDPHANAMSHFLHVFQKRHGPEALRCLRANEGELKKLEDIVTAVVNDIEATVALELEGGSAIALRALVDDAAAQVRDGACTTGGEASAAVAVGAWQSGTGEGSHWLTRCTCDAFHDHSCSTHSTHTHGLEEQRPPAGEQVATACAGDTLATAGGGSKDSEVATAGRVKVTRVPGRSNACRAAHLEVNVPSLMSHEFVVTMSHRELLDAGVGALAFESESGHMCCVQAHEFANLLAAKSPPLRCVVLNACGSTLQGLLVSHKVPLTIAMGGRISDAEASAFSHGFYDALAAGTTVQAAYGEGVQRVKLHALDRGVPHRARPLQHGHPGQDNHSAPLVTLLKQPTGVLEGARDGGRGPLHTRAGSGGIGGGVAGGGVVPGMVGSGAANGMDEAAMASEINTLQAENATLQSLVSYGMKLLRDKELEIRGLSTQLNRQMVQEDHPHTHNTPAHGGVGESGLRVNGTGEREQGRAGTTAAWGTPWVSTSRDGRGRDRAARHEPLSRRKGRDKDKDKDKDKDRERPLREHVGVASRAGASGSGMGGATAVGGTPGSIKRKKFVVRETRSSRLAKSLMRLKKTSNLGADSPAAMPLAPHHLPKSGGKKQQTALNPTPTPRPQRALATNPPIAAAAADAAAAAAAAVADGPAATGGSPQAGARSGLPSAASPPSPMGGKPHQSWLATKAAQVGVALHHAHHPHQHHHAHAVSSQPSASSCSSASPATASLNAAVGAGGSPVGLSATAPAGSMTYQFQSKTPRFPSGDETLRRSRVVEGRPVSTGSANTGGGGGGGAGGGRDAASGRGAHVAAMRSQSPGFRTTPSSVFASTVPRFPGAGGVLSIFDFKYNEAGGAGGPAGGGLVNPGGRAPPSTVAYRGLNLDVNSVPPAVEAQGPGAWRFRGPGWRV